MSRRDVANCLDVVDRVNLRKVASDIFLAEFQMSVLVNAMDPAIGAGLAQESVFLKTNSGKSIFFSQRFFLVQDIFFFRSVPKRQEKHTHTHTYTHTLRAVHPKTPYAQPAMLGGSEFTLSAAPTTHPQPEPQFTPVTQVSPSIPGSGLESH